MSFFKDLNFGKKYEQLFGRLTNCPFINSTAVDQWDIDLTHNDKHIKYEVKTDKQMYKTGNICIEFICNNKPSGIMITEAEYYIFVEIIDYSFMKGDNYNYEYNMYVIKTDDLKDIINNIDIDKTQRRGGDGFKSHFYLINKRHFEKYKITDFNSKFYIYDSALIDFNDNKQCLLI